MKTLVLGNSFKLDYSKIKAILSLLICALVGTQQFFFIEDALEINSPQLMGEATTFWARGYYTASYEFRFRTYDLFAIDSLQNNFQW